MTLTGVFNQPAVLISLIMWQHSAKGSGKRRFHFNFLILLSFHLISKFSLDFNHYTRSKLMKARKEIYIGNKHVTPFVYVRTRTYKNITRYKFSKIIEKFHNINCYLQILRVSEWYLL